MMHLTADISAASATLHRPVPVVAQSSQIPSLGVLATNQPTAFFFSRKPNFLENRRPDFHYSVIGQIATTLLAPEYVRCQALNDDDAASSDTKSRISATWVELTPSVGNEPSIDENSTNRPDCAFEPIIERMIEMTVISPRTGKLVSCSRLSE